MIGLFLGDTDFSDIVLSKIKKQNIEYFIIDFSKKNKFKKDKHSFKISIGKFGGEKTNLEIGDNNKIREYVTIHPGTKGGGGLT